MTNRHRAFAILLAAAALWMLCSAFLVPALIRDAYYGRSSPLLNSVISGQAVHDLQHYLAAWRRLATSLGCALIATGCTLIVAWPRLRRLAADMGFHQMRPARVWIALTLVALLGAGSFYDIVAAREHWPFSDYAMYSRRETLRELTAYQVYVLRSGGQEVYVAEIPPLSAPRLEVAVKRAQQRGVQVEAARQLFRVYRDLNPEDPAVALRLYRCMWKLDAAIANIASPQRTLVAEYGAGPTH